MFVKVFAFYLVTLLFSGGLVALQTSAGPDPDLLQLVQFAPALGVGVMWLLFRRSTRVAARFTPVGPMLARSGLAVGITAAAMLVTAAVLLIAGEPIRTAPAFPWWALVLTMTIGSAGEELGWRAYLQPYLQTRFTVLRSSLIVGLLWGFWHIGGFAQGLAYMTLFVVMAVAISVVLGALLRSARGANLAIATVLHTAVNLALLGLFHEESGDLVPMAALAGVWTVSAIAVHLATNGAKAAGGEQRERGERRGDSATEQSPLRTRPGGRRTDEVVGDQ